MPSHPTTWNGGRLQPQKKQTSDAEQQQQQQQQQPAEPQLHLGWLLCWGRNPAGQSKDPCRVLLLPEGPPQRPQSCKATVEKTIVVSCSSGFDGAAIPA